jgi:hypothetical protein
MSTTVEEPIYIDGVPTHNLHLEIYPHKQYLYINGIRAKELPDGAHYQRIEPRLFVYLDEICLKGNTEIFVDDESYQPFFIQVNNEIILLIENFGTTFQMDTELGLDDIRNISNRIERAFTYKIIPALKEVGLYD